MHFTAIGYWLRLCPTGKVVRVRFIKSSTRIKMYVSHNWYGTPKCVHIIMFAGFRVCHHKIDLNLHHFRCWLDCLGVKTTAVLWQDAMAEVWRKDLQGWYIQHWCMCTTGTWMILACFIRGNMYKHFVPAYLCGGLNDHQNVPDWVITHQGCKASSSLKLQHASSNTQTTSLAQNMHCL